MDFFEYDQEVHMTYEKHFTVHEANALLPILREQLVQLQTLIKEYELLLAELQDLKEVLEEQVGEIAGDPFFEEEVKLDFIRIEAESLIKAIQRHGVELKMICPGLIDFPTIHRGHEVFLCWREGESKISHYHHLHEGFNYRKSLDLDREDV